MGKGRRRVVEKIGIWDLIVIRGRLVEDMWRLVDFN
jgi:hypothetical protein